MKPDTEVQTHPRKFLDIDDPLKTLTLTWNEVYPIISQQHTVTTVEGFLFDVLEVGGTRTDGDDQKTPLPRPAPMPPPAPAAA